MSISRRECPGCEIRGPHHVGNGRSSQAGLFSLEKSKLRGEEGAEGWQLSEGVSCGRASG